MKRILCTVLVLCVLVSLTACRSNPQKETAAGFKPALDTDTSCSITVAGSYDNFEALEMAFDRFNGIYPNVQLSYVKLDDYNNVLATALDGNDKPNIFFSFSWYVLFLFIT
jgi:multiple sugar transport system substrate-binding protein